jgi:uncharacterized protein YdeI (YjbR/CyaY-like superfamily)
MGVQLGALDDAPRLEPNDRSAWRAWLAENHASARGVWLVTRKASAGRPALDYEGSIEEALCFGWVDGQAGRVDGDRTKLYFAPRRRGSPWAATNKVRVKRLIEAGVMAPAGQAAIDRAMKDGSWSVLDSAERLEVPADLATALAARPPAQTQWGGFPPSARKALLSWIALAKRPETRARRIEETATAAQRGERANAQPG